MELPYRPEMVEGAARHFDAVVTKINEKDFRVPAPPAAAVCKECDLRPLCLQDGTIQKARNRRLASTES